MTLGLEALGAMEQDFMCAGMCDLSRYYTFSDVSIGKPSITCKEAVTDVVSSNATFAAIWFWIFTVLTLGCFIVIAMMSSRKYHDDLVEPLIGKGEE